MAQDAYVFGYGSLIERASRTRTNPEAVDARPARVTWNERGWFHQFAEHVGSTCTYLGAIEKPCGRMNGVIYRVDDFKKTRERETGYTARSLSPDKIAMLDGAGQWDPSKVVYIFVSDPACISNSGAPTSAVLIVQSYVDMCINGCLEIEALCPLAHDFVQEFIRTCTGWNANWVNDRIFPRRPFFHPPNAVRIDRALHEVKVLHYVQLHDVVRSFKPNPA